MENGETGCTAWAWHSAQPPYSGPYPRLPGRGLWGNVRVSLPCRVAARVTCRHYRAYGEAVALVLAQDAANVAWETAGSSTVAVRASQKGICCLSHRSLGFCPRAFNCYGMHIFPGGLVDPVSWGIGSG